MAEYIEREAAIRIAKKHGLTSGSSLGQHSGIADWISDELADIPAADVEPVRHGRLVEHSGGEPIDAQAALNFLRGYVIEDKEQVYTNGSMLVPLFRVEQALIDRAYNGFMGG